MDIIRNGGAAEPTLDTSEPLIVASNNRGRGLQEKSMSPGDGFEPVQDMAAEEGTPVEQPAMTPEPARETYSTETAPATTQISADAFPFPDRADTFARPLSEQDQIALEQRRKFADRQAEAATEVLNAIAARDTPPTADDWRAAYESLTQWRSGLDAARLGKGVAQGKDRITTPITDDSPNRDRIGDLGRLRAGSTWDDEQQAWVGGEPTPASRVVAEAGERAQARFEIESIKGDELQNIVRLPDGTTIPGNKIIRGEAAQRVVQELKEGVALRGHDVSQFETGGDLLFTVTADTVSRQTMLTAAMEQLASQRLGECAPETFADIAYLMYQSPQYKKGSDAVIRSFLVASGTYALGYTPRVPHDIDLRAYTSSQAEFVSYLSEYQRRNG